MNKLMTATALMLAMAGAAQAEGMMDSVKSATKDMRPYVGVDYSRVMADYQNSGADDVWEDGFDGVTPYAGVQFNKYVAAEINYLQTADGNKVSTVLGSPVKTEAEISGIGLDVIGSYPVHPCLNLLGSVGVGEYNLDIKASSGAASINADESDTALRAGVGAQYQLTDNWGVRGMVRYIDAEFDGATDFLATADVGVNYRF